MSDIDAVLNEVAPNIQDGGSADPAPKNPKGATDDGSQPSAPSQDFPESEYENEEDPDFDTDKVRIAGRKAWPKKYSNALARRDQELTKLRAQIRAQEQGKNLQQPAPANNGDAAKQTPQYSKEQQSKLDELNAKQPKLDDFEDYGDFIDKLTDWKADVRDLKRDFRDEQRKTEEKTSVEQEQKFRATEQRIATQAKAFIEKHPEYLQIVQENADILQSFDSKPHLLEAFGNVERPELAFLVLSQTPGALQALLNMQPMQAAMYVAQANAIGVERMAALESGSPADAEAEQEQEPEPQQQPRSKAPTPIKGAKGVKGGKKGLSEMNADELDKVLNFSEM